MAAGITGQLWTLEDIVAKIDAMAPAPKPRGPYKKRAWHLAKWIPALAGPALAFLCLYLIPVLDAGDYLRTAVEAFGTLLSLPLMVGILGLFIGGPIFAGYKVYRGLQAWTPSDSILARIVTVAAASLVGLVVAFALMNAIPKAFQFWMEITN